MPNTDGTERKADTTPETAANATNGLSRNADPATQQEKKAGRRVLGRLWEALKPPLPSQIATPDVVAVVPVEVLEPDSNPKEDAAKTEATQVQILAARWSRRRDIPLAILAWSGVVILIIWMAGHIITTILLLVIAALLAYALAPAVGILARVMPRFLAILIVYLIFLGGICGLMYLIVRTAVDQVSSLSHYVNFLLTVGKGHRVSPLEQFLNSLGISSQQIDSFRNQILNSASGLAGDVLPILSGVLSGIVDIILVAILSIYLLIDGGRATNWLRNNMPQRQRGRVAFVLNTLQRVVGGYIRGQLILCSLIGVLVGVGMAILGVPYALLLGVLAFVLEFIPILGVLVSGAICVLLALTKGWLIALIVLAYFVVVHVIEGDVVGPRVVGGAVGLHPIISIAAVIAGAELFGIWGALLASPVVGVIQAFLIAIWWEWRDLHPHEFEQTKEKTLGKTGQPPDDKKSDEEPEAKLLS
jgi:predicted PurR-regulated permease PerM